MSRTVPELTTFHRAICAVFGASFGLLAVASQNTLLRALTAVAGSGLLLRAAVSRAPSHTSATHPTGLDNTLADTFPASDPPASRSPDVPPSNAEAKWQAHRTATGIPDDTKAK
jgi:hypothetical protein